MKSIHITAEVLASRMLLALQEEGAKHIDHSPGTNHRAYKCSVSNCSRLAYAKGYCNAHYIRKRNGTSLELPIENRKRGGRCIECGAPTNKNGGLGRCKKHYVRFRGRAVKQVCIDALGGCCARCGGTFPLRVFDFHHSGNKDFAIGNAMYSLSMTRIAKEVLACELLCANCHRMEHDDDGI